MKEMYELKEKLQDELDEIARKPELSAGDLEHAHKLTDTIKNIDKICMLEEEGGYSQAVDYDGYGRGNSYARGGRHYVRGHYSRDDGTDGRRDNRGRYSRGDGRSEMMEHLEMALDSADEKDREMIRRMMKQIESA